MFLLSVTRGAVFNVIFFFWWLYLYECQLPIFALTGVNT